MRITIFGSGYVGLVTGACLADAGNQVVCVDVDERKIEMLKRGEVPIHEPGLDAVVKRNFDAGRLTFTTNAKEGVDHGQFQLIAVGTPPDEDGSADLRYVLAVARTIGQHMTEYKVVITKSTVPVGTADKVRAAVGGVAARRASASIPYDTVSNPEFLKEGAAIADFMKPDRVVVGTDSERACGPHAGVLYEPFTRNRERMIVMDVQIRGIDQVCGQRDAGHEDQLHERTGQPRRAVSARTSRRCAMGIGSDPRIGYSFIYPGAGYGGSCFPKDVQALKRSADEVGYDASILTAVEDVNNRQKQCAVQENLGGTSATSSGKTIALWGLAFKPNTDDMRAAREPGADGGAVGGGGVGCAPMIPVAMPECTRESMASGPIWCYARPGPQARRRAPMRWPSSRSGGNFAARTSTYIKSALCARR